MKGIIYTVGHSNHAPEYFLALLQAHDINCVVDVRSVAASAHNPQFNKALLEAYLKNHGIRYLHFAREFGARHEDPALHDSHGKVDFEKVRRTAAFREGVERLETGAARGFRIALMCSEGEPLECHRFSMISGHLQAEGFEVLHILRDSTLVPHPELEEAMLEKYHKKLPRPSLFEPDIDENTRIAAAYRLHNQEVGWSAKQLETEIE